MKKIKAFIYFYFFIIVFVPLEAFSQDINSKKEFGEFESKYEESRAWARCSAAYLFYSEILIEDKPATAKQVKNLSNGAKLTSQVSIFLRSLGEDYSAEELSTAWSGAKLTSESDYEIAVTALAAQFEESSSTAIEELSSMLDVCSTGLKRQQAYVEAYREMVSTGILVDGK